MPRPAADTAARSGNERRLERRVLTGFIPSMSDATAEIIAVCEALPPAKRAEVADFAKFLLTRESDARWDAIIDDPQPRPKLEAFVEKAAAEGSEPLDLDRM